MKTGMELWNGVTEYGYVPHGNDRLAAFHIVALRSVTRPSLLAAGSHDHEALRKNKNKKTR